MHFTGSEGIGQVLLSSSATQYHPPGYVAQTANGCTYRYVLAGTTALVAGNVIQAPAQVTDHDQLTPSAAAIGATSITVTLDATLASLNQYAGGLAVIDTTPGQGYSYVIQGHPAASASASLTVTLDPADSIQVALTASSRVTLVPNPYRGVIQSPVTTLTNALVGVAVYPIAASEWGWVQTHGPCGVLINGTPAVGQLVGGPGTVAGAADINASTEQFIGSMMVTGVDAKILPVFLML